MTYRKFVSIKYAALSRQVLNAFDRNTPYLLTFNLERGGGVDEIENIRLQDGSRAQAALANFEKWDDMGRQYLLAEQAAAREARALLALRVQEAQRLKEEEEARAERERMAQYQAPPVIESPAPVISEPPVAETESAPPEPAEVVVEKAAPGVGWIESWWPDGK